MRSESLLVETVIQSVPALPNVLICALCSANICDVRSACKSATSITESPLLTMALICAVLRAWICAVVNATVCSEVSAPIDSVVSAAIWAVPSVAKSFNSRALTCPLDKLAICEVPRPLICSAESEFRPAVPNAAICAVPRAANWILVSIQNFPEESGTQ